MTSSSGPQPFRDARRKGIGWQLVGTANVLQALHDSNLGEVKDQYDYNSFNHKELEALLKVKKMLRWQIKAMRAVARSMGVKETEWHR